MYQTKICPLLAAGPVDNPNFTCKEDRCAWFHIVENPEDGTVSGECAILDIARALSKKTAASAANTDDGKETTHRP